MSLVNELRAAFLSTSVHQDGWDAVADKAEELLAGKAATMRARVGDGHPFKPPLGVCDICGIASAIHDHRLERRDPTWNNHGQPYEWIRGKPVYVRWSEGGRINANTRRFHTT